MVLFCDFHHHGECFDNLILSIKGMDAAWFEKTELIESAVKGRSGQLRVTLVGMGTKCLENKT